MFSGGLDGGNDHVAVGLDEELHEPHGVVALFRGLLVEMGGQLRQRFRVEVRGDGYVLQRSTEFVSDLLVDRVVDLFTDKHDAGNNVTGGRQMQFYFAPRSSSRIGGEDGRAGSRVILDLARNID